MMIMGWDFVRYAMRGCVRRGIRVSGFIGVMGADPAIESVRERSRTPDSGLVLMEHWWF